MLARNFLTAVPKATFHRSLSSLSPNLYTASSTSTGSRAKGTAFTEEKNISLTMGFPTEMGGATGPAGGQSNPEQLFGLAYSTCFLSALGATQGNVFPDLKPLGKSTAVRALVSIGKDPKGTPGFLLGVELEVLKGPLAEAGLNEAAMQKLVEEAHKLCPICLS